MKFLFQIFNFQYAIFLYHWTFVFFLIEFLHVIFSDKSKTITLILDLFFVRLKTEGQFPLFPRCSTSGSPHLLLVLSSLRCLIRGLIWKYFRRLMVMAWFEWCQVQKPLRWPSVADNSQTVLNLKHMKHQIPCWICIVFTHPMAQNSSTSNCQIGRRNWHQPRQLRQKIRQPSTKFPKDIRMLQSENRRIEVWTGIKSERLKIVNRFWDYDLVFGWFQFCGVFELR